MATSADGLTVEEIVAAYVAGRQEAFRRIQLKRDKDALARDEALRCAYERGVAGEQNHHDALGGDGQPVHRHRVMFG